MIRKRLRGLRQNKRAESVMYPFILILALVLVLAMVINGLANFAVSGEVSRGLKTMTMPFGLRNMTTIAADSEDDRYVSFTIDGHTIEGYEVTEDDILDEVPYPTDENPFRFWDDEDDEDVKYVHVIMDNIWYDPDVPDRYETRWSMYDNFLAIRRDTGDWIGERWNGAAVTFEEVEENFYTTLNASTVEFKLSGSDDNLFVNATTGPGAANFTTALWNGHFYLFYGWSLFRLEEQDFWGAISMILYADVPGVNDYVDFIIHAFVIGTVTFVCVTVGLRMIPFLGD